MIHSIRSSAGVASRERYGRVGVVVEHQDALRTHLIVLGLICIGTMLLRFRPEWVLGAGVPCAMRLLLHINCPFCGMTRDFVAILHGNHPKLNPFSWPAAGCLYVVYPSVLLWAWKRRRMDVFYQPAVYQAGLAGLLLMFVANNLFS